MASNYIRFDWAMKRLLRNKANFAVLEGFLTTFLGDQSLFRNYWRVNLQEKKRLFFLFFESVSCPIILNKYFLLSISIF